MSGEINYRNFAGTPGRNPKYLSDSLDNFYNTWSGSNVQILYTNLPPADGVIAKIKSTATIAVWSNLFIASGAVPFRTHPLNLNDYVIEFWIRSDIPPQGLYLTPYPIVTTYGLLNNMALPTTTWNKRTLYMPSSFSIVPAGSLVSRTLIAAKISLMYFQFYHATLAADIEIGGMTFRRL